MFCILILLIGILGATPAHAYRAGIFADAPDSTCIATPGEFEQFAWVWTPDGTVYVTLRIEFPDNLDFRSDPVFDSRVIEFTQTAYPDGSEEWHMVLEGCPAGWVEIFRQSVIVLDDQPSDILIRGADSWIRDCSFVLHRPDVVGNVELNEPGCESVRAEPSTWSTLKASYE